ncbi:MAG: (2Fe-2S)-binding protein [bacterium]
MSDQNGSHAEEQKREFSRRLFMKGMGTSVISASAISGGVAAAAEAESSEAGDAIGPGLVPLSLKINGKEYNVKAEPRETLLEVLRNRLDLTGSKLVCGQGTCGACTVHLDGKAAYSCLMLAVQAQGKEVRTIEGLAESDENLHPVQQAFIRNDALQCGFCTPGFIMSMAAVHENNPNATVEDYREGIAGNICRCGTYTQIFSAADDLARNRG